MIKLLIVDDEPLVCVGIKSMISWEELDIEIIGTARNGVIAMEQIEKFKPDIVISDIKMPLKTGLELIEESASKFGRLPLFIMLTSYEEFNYVRTAIKFQSVDYLIKPELTQETLTSAVLKAIKILRDYDKIEIKTSTKNTMQSMKDKFFTRLYNNMFENFDQFLVQAKELNIDFSSSNYVTINSKIHESATTLLSTEKLFNLCASTSEIVRETFSKEYAVNVTIMDIRHFTITIGMQNNSLENIKLLLEKSIQLVHSYFNVTMLSSVGLVVCDPFDLYKSYYTSQSIFHKININNKIVLYSDIDDKKNEPLVFSSIRPELRKAFEEINTEALNNVLTTISDFYENNPDLFIEAVDVASNILYLTKTLLPDSEENISNIFSSELDSYRCIYRYTTTDDVVHWIRKLRDGTIDILSLKRKDYKNQVVQNVKSYILENLNKRLSLNDVASIFNFNPNYLSHLFAKYSECTFVEFITISKMNKAKELLLNGDMRINEIAELLGFDNAFYFSKVFKKYIGMSPREFQNKQIGGTNNEFN